MLGLIAHTAISTWQNALSYFGSYLQLSFVRPSGCACVTSGLIKILDTPLQTDYKERNFWSLNQWNNRCRDKRRCLALCVHKTTKVVFLSVVSGFSLGISSHGIWLPQLRPRPPWHSLCFSDLRRTKFFHEKVTFFEKEKNWSSICVCVWENIIPVSKDCLLTNSWIIPCLWALSLRTAVNTSHLETKECLRDSSGH